MMTPEIQALTEGLKEAKRQGNQRAMRHLGDKLEQIRAQSIETPAVEQPSLGERVIHGIREPALGALQFVSNKLPAVGDKIDALDQWAANTKIGKAVGLVAPQGGYRQAVPAWQKEYDQTMKDTGFEGVDWGRLAGNIVSPVNLAIGAGAGSAAKGIGGKIAGALRYKIPAAASGALKALGIGGAGAASGAAGALTAPVSDDGDFDEQKINQLKSGAILGGALSVAGPAIGRVLNPQTSKNVELLLKEGVTPTPGQILGGIPKSIEDKASSLLFVGDLINSARGKSIDEFNQAAYARALSNIGAKLPQKTSSGHEAIEAMDHVISRNYKKLLPRLNFKTDQAFIDNVSEIYSHIKKTVPKSKQKRFNADIADFFSRARNEARNEMSGQDYYLAMSNIKRKIKDYLSNSDIDVQSLGRALSDFRNAAQESLHRVPGNDPDILGRLKMTDKAYAEADRVINAAASHGARAGVFSPAALRSAVRAGDRSLRKKSYAKGRALLQDLSDAGVDVLGSNYPDSGTAGRIFAGSLLGGGLGGGIGGGLATGSPIGAGAAIGAGVAALPYVAGGREVAAALLARRPNFTRAISPYPAMAIKAVTPGLTNYIENRESY